jgi:cytochrome P450
MGTVMAPGTIPYAPGSSWLGHIQRFRDDRLGLLRDVGRTGPLARVRLLHREVVFVSAPDAVHEMLVEKARSFEKSPGLRLMLRELAGEGLFTSEGELWRKQRKLMSPLFHPSALGGYARSMNEEAHRALARWRDGDRVDLAHEMMRITMGVVGRTLFGADSFDEEDLGEALTVALQWVDRRVAARGMVAQMTLLELTEDLEDLAPGPVASVLRRARGALQEPWLLPGHGDPTLLRAVARVDGAMKQLIDVRRGLQREGRVDDARADLLTRLLQARGDDGEGMSDSQVRDESNTLFVAGHETTATALSWAFYLLARHPEALARAQAEADTFGPEGPTTWDPERLSFSTRVFKEALRMYPPVLVLARRTREAVAIGGHVIPKRQLCFVSPYAVHMRPDDWPDPDRFDPDRFTREREAARPRSAWVPFGLGPRVCIGNHFALMEGPIVLATLLRNARLETDASRVIQPDLVATLRPKGGVPAVVRRDSQGARS